MSTKFTKLLNVAMSFKRPAYRLAHSILLPLLCTARQASTGVILSERLQQVYALVPRDDIAADIGAGHGLLSCALANKCRHVYCIDRSKAESEQAYKNVKSHRLDSEVTIMNGFGVEPLVLQAIECDTLIILGMGIGSMVDVFVSPNNLSGQNSDQREKLDVCNFVGADLSYLKTDLGIKRVILQPWPPNIIANHMLHKTLLLNNWRYREQSVTSANGCHYITTVFSHLSDDNEKLDNRDSTISDDADVFSLCPLARRYCSSQYNETSASGSRQEIALSPRTGPYSRFERINWKGYLAKQLRSLDMRMQGLKKDRDKEDRRRAVNYDNDDEKSFSYKKRDEEREGGIVEKTTDRMDARAKVFPLRGTKAERRDRNRRRLDDHPRIMEEYSLACTLARLVTEQIETIDQIEELETARQAVQRS